MIKRRTADFMVKMKQICNLNGDLFIVTRIYFRGNFKNTKSRAMYIKYLKKFNKQELCLDVFCAISNVSKCLVNTRVSVIINFIHRGS